MDKPDLPEIPEISDPLGTPDVPEILEIESDIPDIPEEPEPIGETQTAYSDTGLNEGVTAKSPPVSDASSGNLVRNPEGPPQIPGMLVTQDEDGVNVLHLPDTPSKMDQRLEKRMEEKVVDLSTPTEWGKFAHGAYEEAQEGIDPTVSSEVPVTWTDEDGVVHSGRIDTLTSTAIWDYKTGDLSTKTDSQLKAELTKFANQLENYANSDKGSHGLERVLFFEKQPTDSARVEIIESFLKNKGVSVKWGNL